MSPRRDTVLKAAVALFAEQGFAATSINDIERAAGLSVGSGGTYRHFKSKEALYLQVVDRAFAEIQTAMARGMSRGEGYEERIVATVEELLQFQQDHRELMAVVFRALTSPGSASHESIAAKFSPLIDQLEALVVSIGSDRLPEGWPVRAIVMQLIVSRLTHAAMGDLGDALWGGDTRTLPIARMLLIPQP